jgi:DNA polymerase I-like protein with 3'-5' exonuclease and polymerase domains
VFVPRCRFVKKVVPKVKKDGGYSTVGLKFLGDDCLRVVGGEFSRVEYPEFNLGSRKQIGEYLIHFGWKPKTFTPTEQPIVDEAVLSEVTDIPQAQLIAEFLLVQKRVAMVQSWLDAEVDGRVHGRVNSNGAVTGRMTHSSPNLAQVPASYSPYGKQCREVWTVEEGYRLVGCDASGLELRMLAHYMNDEDYTKELLNGDIHTFNQQAAGLPTRDLAKTFIYAFLYGAGDAKIGDIAGGTKQDGRKLKAKFLRNTPALARLRERVEEAANRGWLKGLDGRRIAVRSPHAALNTLLQGAGAVVMKQALIRLDQMATAHGLNYYFVGNVHDEIQSEVAAKDATAFGKLAAYSIARAGQDFKLRCPLAGEYQIGTNWSETH